MKQLTVLSTTALLTAWTALRPSAGVTTAADSAAATAPMAAPFRTAMGREARPAFAAALPRAEGGHGAGLAFAPARLRVAAGRGRRTELTAAPRRYHGAYYGGAYGYHGGYYGGTAVVTPAYSGWGATGAGAAVGATTVAANTSPSQPQLIDGASGAEYLEHSILCIERVIS
jgi:hypothetical protein